MGAVRENEIGLARCPACRSGKASLRVSAKGLAYLVCNDCNTQVFARSDRSDEKLRAMLLTVPAPQDPESEPKPDAPKAPTAAPVAASAPKPEPEKAPRGMGWGVFA